MRLSRTFFTLALVGSSIYAFKFVEFDSPAFAQNVSVSFSEDPSTPLVVINVTATPTPTATVTGSVTPQATATPIHSPTPTPTPIPTAVEGQCYGAITISRHYNAGARGSLEEFHVPGGGRFTAFDGPGAQLSCIQQIVSRCGGTGSGFADDCIAETLAQFGGDGGFYNVGDAGVAGMTNIGADGSERCARGVVAQGCTGEGQSAWTRGADASRTLEFRFSTGSINSYIFQTEDYTSFIDENCNVRHDVPPDRLCASRNLGFRYLVSPISLLWSQPQLSGQVSLVQFPLDPELKGKWVEWRASADAPLLAYDPNHTGIIASGEQLFGTETFGRKWSNGFEALGSLDANQDRVISGEELHGLVLWFDANSDGISQPGEVQTLVAVGVTKLYYENPKARGSRGDLYLERAFELGDSGFGGAVDWFAEVYDSPSGVNARRNAALPGVERRDFTVAAKSKLSGMWVWKGRGDQSRHPAQGIIRILEGETHDIVGRSFVETPLKRNSDGLGSVIRSFPLSGHTKRNSDGLVEVQFQVHSKEGSRTSSVAILSSDGKKLHGRSMIDLESKDASDPTQLVYSWEAEKL